MPLMFFVEVALSQIWGWAVAYEYCSRWGC